MTRAKWHDDFDYLYTAEASAVSIDVFLNFKLVSATIIRNITTRKFA